MRTRKLLLIVGVAAAISLVHAGGASAKLLLEPTRVTIRGPGLSEAVAVDGDRWLLMRANELGTTSITSASFGPRHRIPRPAGSLGPSYDLTYELVSPAITGEIGTLTQRLYPFAEQGPVVLTPAQEVQVGRFGSLEVSTEWLPVPPRVMREVRKLGLPAGPPRWTPLQWPIITGTAVVLAMALAALVARRRRRSRLPTPVNLETETAAT